MFEHDDFSLIILLVVVFSFTLALLNFRTLELGSKSLLFALLGEVILLVHLTIVTEVENEDDDVRDELCHRVAPDIE